jgi:hypothetical protein
MFLLLLFFPLSEFRPKTDNLFCERYFADGNFNFDCTRGFTPGYLYFALSGQFSFFFGNAHLTWNLERETWNFELSRVL